MSRCRPRAICLACSVLLIAGCTPEAAVPALTEPVSGPQTEQPAKINPPSTAISTADQSTVSEAGSSQTDDTIEHGRRVYQRQCGACHSLDQNRVGPKHRGVVGRDAGGVRDFRYSRALQNIDLIWTAETLDVWLENPSQVAPNTAMGFRLRDAEDRAAVIAYLESVSE